MNNIEEKIGYKFKDKSLLSTALTHISYSNDFGVESYERLEFLGDAVLELVVSEYIYKFNELDSGALTKLRAALVSTDNLSKISQNLNLDKKVLKSKSLNMLSRKNTADLFESLLGAIYLDSGLDSAREIINKFVIVSDLSIMQTIKNSIDFKTKLQEEMQKIKKPFEYRLVRESGLDHDKTFEVELYIEGEFQTRGIGKSIQLAQENSARLYFEKIKN